MTFETKIMAAVWEQQEATVRSVTDALAEDADGPRSYTTILTVMTRLDRKGFLDRRREGKRGPFQVVAAGQRRAERITFG